MPLGLRSRFVLACLALVTISTAGYYVAVERGLEFFENAVLEIELDSQLEAFANRYLHDPETAPPESARIRGYVLRTADDPAAVPAALHSLVPGQYQEVRIDGREMMVIMRRAGQDALYLAMDMESLEAMEARFVNLAWLCAIASWITAVVLALWLAGRVLRPVTQLAERVATAEPGVPIEPLARTFAGEDVGVIARAFDRYVERMDAFVARERAFTEEASHELRTPLSVIDSASQLLASDETLDPGTLARVGRIQRATQQMRMQIEALLFLAREDGGHSSDEIRLDELVKDIVDNAREGLRETVQLSIRKRPTQVLAPHGMVTCVVSNLLNNALHFTERGEVSVAVEPGRLKVRDTGVGIAPNSLERIFDRHFRGSNSRGLGLGLYLVKRICDRLGWRIDVSSAEGAGTCFEVTWEDRSQRKTNDSPTRS